MSIDRTEIYRIRYIYEELEILLERQGTQKENDDIYYDKEYYKKYPDELNYEEYPVVVQNKMKQTLNNLKSVYSDVLKISKYLDGDIGETDL